MGLITKEEVLALREELTDLLALVGAKTHAVDAVILTVLEKMAPEKLLADYELERFYRECANRQNILNDVWWNSRVGALMLQAPEFMRLFEQKDHLSEMIERMAETYLNPPKAEEL